MLVLSGTAGATPARPKLPVAVALFLPGSLPCSTRGNVMLRTVLLTALVLVLMACAPQAGARPNVLFIISDDQSWPHASAYGDPVVATPSFDRIAAEGVLFTHACTASPSCTGARSAILTGQDIWRLREAGILHGSIPPDLPLLPLLLEDAGYFVGFTGKGW